MSFLDGGPRDWGHRPLPEGPIPVGIAGAYVRDGDEPKRQVEVMVGKRIRAFRRDEEEAIPARKCLGFVPTVDAKPTRRLFEVLKSQGFPMHPPRTCRAAGGDPVRDLQRYLSPAAEPWFAWCQGSMRLPVLQQTATGLPDKIREEQEASPLRDPVVRALERLQWVLWHGNVYKALPVVQSVEMDLEAAVATSRDHTARKRLKAVEDFHP
jgi:hypothetical protein